MSKLRTSRASCIKFFFFFLKLTTHDVGKGVCLGLALRDGLVPHFAFPIF